MEDSGELPVEREKECIWQRNRLSMEDSGELPVEREKEWSWQRNFLDSVKSTRWHHELDRRFEGDTSLCLFFAVLGVPLVLSAFYFCRLDLLLKRAITIPSLEEHELNPLCSIFLFSLPLSVLVLSLSILVLNLRGY